MQFGVWLARRDICESWRRPSAANQCLSLCIDVRPAICSSRASQNTNVPGKAPYMPCLFPLRKIYFFRKIRVVHPTTSHIRAQTPVYRSCVSLNEVLNDGNNADNFLCPSPTLPRGKKRSLQAMNQRSVELLNNFSGLRSPVGPARALVDFTYQTELQLNLVDCQVSRTIGARTRTAISRAAGNAEKLPGHFLTPPICQLAS